MYFLEYTLPMRYYYITIYDDNPDHVSPNEKNTIPESSIRISIHDPDPAWIKDLRDFAEQCTVEEFGDYFDDDEMFFDQHYKDIICGKYPEWIIVGIAQYHGLRRIDFINTKSLSTGRPSMCWVTCEKSVNLSVEVFHPTRPVEKYLLKSSSVTEYGEKRRRVFYLNDDHATVEEYAYL